MASNKRWGCGIALGLLLILGIIVPVLLISVATRTVVNQLSLEPQPQSLPDFSETVVDGTWSRQDPGKGKIAVVPVTGVITSFSSGGLLGSGSESMVDRVRRQLRQAVDDENVKAIVLGINSPGGEVTASDHLYQAVLEAAAAKPVVAHFDSVAASGGYYLACGATSIVASETGITGSIGVIIQSLNYADLFDKAGLEMLTFASGEFKDTLSGARPMREDERAYIKGIVNDMYERFVNVVAEGRDLPLGRVRSEIADGRIFTGAQALELKLVDATGTIEEAYAEARRLARAPGAVAVRYGPGGSGLARLLGAHTAAAEASGKGTKLEVDVSQKLLPRLKPGVPYYLAPSMVGWHE